MSHEVLRGCRSSCLVIPDTASHATDFSKSELPAGLRTFFLVRRRNSVNTKFLSRNPPPSLLSLFLDTALLQYLPGHREKRISVELQYWSPAHRCAHYAMSPPAMAPVLGSGAKEYKRESGTARLLGSGIYAQCELEQDSEI
jgi:hypothetical protein